jgi:hypothetical protein
MKLSETEIAVMPAWVAVWFWRERFWTMGICITPPVMEAEAALCGEEKA